MTAPDTDLWNSHIGVDARKRLKHLSKKAHDGEWFVEHAATTDGLSRIDDGAMYGMFPILGEAHEIELAAACVNFVRRFVLYELEP